MLWMLHHGRIRSACAIVHGTMQAGSLARLLCRQMADSFSSMYSDTEALTILLDVAVGLQHLHNASPHPVMVRPLLLCHAWKSWYCCGCIPPAVAYTRHSVPGMPHMPAAYESHLTTWLSAIPSTCPLSQHSLRLCSPICLQTDQSSAAYYV